MAFTSFSKNVPAVNLGGRLSRNVFKSAESPKYILGGTAIAVLDAVR